MNKLKETLYQFRNYLGHFTKRPKKKGKPKLTIANKKQSILPFYQDWLLFY